MPMDGDRKCKGKKKMEEQEKQLGRGGGGGGRWYPSGQANWQTLCQDFVANEVRQQWKVHREQISQTSLYF